MPPGAVQGGRAFDGRRIVVFGAAGVVVAAGVGVGGWFLASSGGTGQPGASPRSVASSGSGASSESGGGPEADSPVPSDTDISPSPRQSGPVAMDPVVAGDPSAPGVVGFLNRYFTAINNHDFEAYDALLSPGMQAPDSGQFDSGYGTTTDSGEILTGIAGGPGGEVVAKVTFTSRQDPSQSPDNSPCDTWNVRLYLVSDGDSYLLTKTPSDYHAQYASCS